nr:hypothetical protein [uncultured Sphingomonas sp.]
MPSKSFGFRTLEISLATAFRIPLDELPRFRARIKQLQRLGFPAGVNIGRGVKMPYSTEHLTKLGLAFSLLESGLTAKIATDLVEQRWDRWRSGFWAVCQADPEDSAVFALIRFHGLTTVSGAAAEVTIEDGNSLLNQQAAVSNGHCPTAHTILNMTALLERLFAQAHASSPIESDQMRYEVRTWLKKPPAYDFLSDGDWFRRGHFNSKGLGFFDGND